MLAAADAGGVVPPAGPCIHLSHTVAVVDKPLWRANLGAAPVGASDSEDAKKLRVALTSRCSDDGPQPSSALAAVAAAGEEYRMQNTTTDVWQCKRALAVQTSSPGCQWQACANVRGHLLSR